MKNKIAIIILIIISTSCKREVESNDVNNFEWIEYKSKDSIPKQIRNLLKALNGNEKIAGFNEDYEATDNITDTLLPTRQLKLIANSNESWRLVYVQGGIGSCYCFIQCKIKNDTLYEPRIAYTLLPINDNDSISKFIKANKLKFQNIKAKYK